MISFPWSLYVTEGQACHCMLQPVTVKIPHITTQTQKRPMAQSNQKFPVE